jgi:hypothetical protein
VDEERHRHGGEAAPRGFFGQLCVEAEVVAAGAAEALGDGRGEEAE